ncbi:MAG: hypothetical protein V4629_11700 [Pseudomonadota bacterium]
MILYLISNPETTNGRFNPQPNDIYVLWPDAHSSYLEQVSSLDYRIWLPYPKESYEKEFKDHPIINSEQLHELIQQADKIIQW